jgi:predicted TIM-barrel fold metal-dependent hydrolase
MRIVDTHQHLLFPGRVGYAWTKAYGLDRSWSLADYRRAAKGTGIAASVFVEVDADERDRATETRLVLDLADDPANGIAGVVAALRPEREDFRTELESLARRWALKGVRRVLHTQPDDLPRSPLFVENVRALARFGLSFDICALPRQLPTAGALVRACPQVAFVLDHLGVPDVAGRALDPWRGHIAELARLPNLSCKISGVIAYADRQAWTVDDLRPFVEHAIACFGWDRVLFGSDWPVCTLSAPLSGWVGALGEIVSGASRDERERLFSRNAERVYRLAGAAAAQAR